MLTQRRAASSEKQLPPSGYASNELAVNAAAVCVRVCTFTCTVPIQTLKQITCISFNLFSMSSSKGGGGQDGSWLEPKPKNRNVILWCHVPLCPLIYSQQ